MAIFTNAAGNETFTGSAAEYDQVNYTGALADYVFTRNADETLTVTHPNLGVDTMSSMEGFWFTGEQAWYSANDAVRLTNDNSGEVTNFEGTAGPDILIGTNQDNVFTGGAGNDYINGNGGSQNVANFDGSLIEYTITRITDGDILVSHPTWGEDTLTDIDRLFFLREGNDYTVDNAITLTADLPAFRLDADNVINGTPNQDFMNGTNATDLFYGGTGNDIFNGRGGFDQVNYDGNLSEYTVTQIDGGFIFEHPVWGIDVLRGIEGLWLSGEAVWYPVLAATFGL